MTWTYTASPGRATPEQRRDAVRVLIHDVDQAEGLLEDASVEFALSETANDVYKAAAMCCRMLAARYSSIADAEVDGMKQSYWKTRDAFMRLATQLEQYAARYSSGGIGSPIAGGVFVSEFEEARNDTSLVQPAFRIRQFDNPSFESDPTDLVKFQ
jgi:hypothetical protein